MSTIDQWYFLLKLLPSLPSYPYQGVGLRFLGLVIIESTEVKYLPYIKGNLRPLPQIDHI